MNYYHCFIKGYAKVTHPLYNQISGDNATQKKMTVMWIEECQEAFDMLKTLCTSTPILALADFTRPFKLHMDASTTGLTVVLYQEQHENNQVKRDASRALSKSESHYPVHKVEFLVLKCPVTESFQEYLYGNPFAVYSDKRPFDLCLDHGQAGYHQTMVIAKLAMFSFTIHYCSRKSNVSADTLSRIPRDQNTEVNAVRTIFKATVDGSEALMKVYTCHKRAVISLILESSPTWMTAMEWVWAQKAGLVICHVTTWIEDGKPGTMKVNEEMSQEVKWYLRQKGQLCLKEGVLYWC